MHLRFFHNATDASSAVAEIIIRQIGRNPASVLGLPTGGSPTLVYSALRQAFDEGRVRFNRVTTFNLDEYIGLGATDAASYANYMRKSLFDYVDCPPHQWHVPNGTAFYPEKEAEEYERKITAVGGIDLLFLGLGRNSHIGFNEPGSSHESRTRMVALSADTIEANARFFPGRRSVPTHAITIGIGTIMEAKHIVLLATGADKAEAVANSFWRSTDERFPASALNAHRNCEIVVDAAAASGLNTRR